MTNYKEKNIIFTIDILFYCIILFLKFYEKIFIADALSERVVGLLEGQDRRCSSRSAWF